MPMDIDAQSDVEAAHPQAPIPPAKVLRAVEEIVNSRLFRTSPQCQKLLRYVVVHTLEGKEEELKERIIGSEVFGRPQDYNTSDDPVVVPGQQTCASGWPSSIRRKGRKR